MNKDDRDAIVDELGTFAGLIFDGCRLLVLGIVVIPMILVASAVEVCCQIGGRAIGR